MKNFALLLFIFSSILVSAQVGINTETPRGILEVSSGDAKNQGLVMPQVTKVEDVVNTQNHEDEVAIGTMVFDLSRDAVCVKHTNGWNCVSMDGSNQTITDPIDYDNQPTYVKASNTDAGDGFGYSVSLSSDGNTLAVGAFQEDSDATGINGEQNDNSADYSGAVYVFVKQGGVWAQEAYIKASNTEASDNFGISLALSADGNTLAVGAYLEDSNATGVNGDQTNNSASGSGAVYVFVRNGTTWAQEAYIKASNTNANDYFGYSVSLSADGNTLAVGAYIEDSDATGINGDQNDNSATTDSGAVYVFVRNGTTWAQEAYIKASNTDAGDGFGVSVSLSSDGNTLAVGALVEASNATGINGDQNDNSASGSGAVYVFVRNGTTWAQEAYIKASNTDISDVFGNSVSLSSDGNTLAIGAPNESSDATGINGDQNDNSALGSGAVYVYEAL